jgi:hypothetical protein
MATRAGTLHLMVLGGNRATYWKKRVELMQGWADLLDQFRLLT